MVPRSDQVFQAIRKFASDFEAKDKDKSLEQEIYNLITFSDQAHGWVERIEKETRYFSEQCQEYMKVIKKFREALIWCGESEDFAKGGKARKGWLKICKPLL